MINRFWINFIVDKRIQSQLIFQKVPILKINLKLLPSMNFLAHQFLSFQNPELQIGNLYGEIVRVKDYLNYPKGIQKGILLHRAIDSYTDSNETVKKSTALFHSGYGKFSPVIVDVLYDYFLIKNWQKYTEINYESFTDQCYRLFSSEFQNFPANLQYIVRHLLDYDWFHKYENYEGIKETLNGISKRSKFKNSIAESVKELILHEDELDKHFNQFFPKLISHCKNFIGNEF